MAEIVVLGAGMVGVSSALALQAGGHDVTIVDRKSPGRETSFGNAGIIQVEAAEPYPLPRDIGTQIRIALGRTNDVFWRPFALLDMAPALLAYFRHSAPVRHATIARVYAGLTSRASRDHAPLIEAANAQNMISREGLICLYRDAHAFDTAAKDAERIRCVYGVTSRALSGVDYRAEEPALIMTPAGAIHWDQSWSCSDPGGLTQAYAELFSRQGGRILRGDALTLSHSGRGWSVLSREGLIEAEQAVVALGPWSPELLKSFGYRIPMIYKRGYHCHFDMPVTLRRPFLDAANGVVAASMRQGLRITTGAALVMRDAPADSRQLEHGRRSLGELLDLGERVEEEQWFGTRPCLPDMLPLVGEAPRHKGLWFNFGHGHQGFTLGPTTASLLSEAITGNAEVVEHLQPTGRLR
ncbi:NAD(P)/FAD-dependent oxidoreductase [Agrobacterium rosae]|uniref:FAD-binding oxidoreductase n=1 Tax=Agrobacterium rosae TaxID=1972867 RepID=A0AAW9FFX2_9HYPH|nr:FAD-binding oxidoreductase [Agrobacterium rosae]MDX8304446.1 FAD-binding oxidoreductase [Agrobacterium rosae]